MTPLREALAAYGQLRPLSSQDLPIRQALGAVLTEAVFSQHDLPPFSQSAMDGYALHADDSGQVLPMVGTIAPGPWPQPFPQLARGTAWRILTGAALPTGANAVVAQERVERLADGVRVPVLAAGRNVRHQGEELPKGHRLAEAGQRLRAPLLASLVQGGVQQVLVRRAPNIAVLITGDELGDGADLAQGRIADSNGPLVQGWLSERGYICTLHRLNDDRPQQQSALQAALDHADLVITTGGASVGDKDHIVGLAQSLGVSKVFWKVAQKPAKPLFFGTFRQGKGAFLALPGNPGAVLVGLVLHVSAALAALEGRPAPSWRSAALAEPVEADPERTRLMRMRLSPTGELQPLGFQDSHMLHNLHAADVLVEVPIGVGTVAAGTRLRFVELS